MKSITWVFINRGITILSAQVYRVYREKLSNDLGVVLSTAEKINNMW